MEEMANRSEFDPGTAPLEPGPRIGPGDISRARERLQKFRAGKQALDRRIIENDQWWRLRHWDMIGRKAGDPQPASAWLFNSVANKHADAMDNAPSPVVLPREASDAQDARTLSDILPVIVEHNGFEATYSDAMWDKIKSGTACYGVFWDPAAENGLGEITIRRVSVLNLFWEPGTGCLDDSSDLFFVALYDAAALKAQYPAAADRIGPSPANVTQYIHDDTIDTTDKTEVVDWYYKRQTGSRTVVHYCKFTGDTLLYASENDPLYAETGYYNHGHYPFVLDRMFPIEDSPAGFGYVDIMQSPQIYIDKLDQIILKNAMLAGRPRWFYRDSCGVNEAEFADWNRDFVHVAGQIEEENLRQIEVKTIPSYIINHQQNKIAELKETSGNRDFTQGGTASGVTAAAAIAALQEAGNKLSRDMLKGTYRAYRGMMTLCIELIRQFYTTEREFRITQPNGAMEFAQYSNAGIRDQALPPAYPGQEMEDGYRQAYRRPVFDVVVKVQKSNPYSQMSQNETAKELYQLGVFQPANADQALALLDMMEFEGVDQVRERVQQNGTMYEQLMQMEKTVQKMAAVIQKYTGADLTGNAAAMAQGPAAPNTGTPHGTRSRGMGAAAKAAQAQTMTEYGERLAERSRADVEG